MADLEKTGSTQKRVATVTAARTSKQGRKERLEDRIVFTIVGCWRRALQSLQHDQLALALRVQILNIRVRQRIMGVEQEYVLMTLHVCGSSTCCTRLTVNILDVCVEVQVEEEWPAMQPVVVRAGCMAQRGYVDLGGLIVT